MKADSLELSIIIPVYNVERYLERCIESVLAQTHTDWEMILVDDGSTDTSGEICDRYAVSDERIRVIHTPNEGQSRARNLALDIAQGKYITFIDADDYLVNNTFFSHGTEILKENITIDILVFSWVRKNLKGNTIARHLCDEMQWRSPADYFRHYEPIIGNKSDCFYVPVWSKFYRRTIFDGIRFHEGKVFEDVAINADLFLRAKGISLSPEICYAYSENEASTMANLNSKKSNDAISANLYVLEMAMTLFGSDVIISRYFAKIFYETCVMGYTSDNKLDYDVTESMAALFKSIKDKKGIPPFTKYLIAMFGVKMARIIYIRLMKIKNNRIHKLWQMK